MLFKLISVVLVEECGPVNIHLTEEFTFRDYTALLSTGDGGGRFFALALALLSAFPLSLSRCKHGHNLSTKSDPCCRHSAVLVSTSLRGSRFCASFPPKFVTYAA